MNLRRRLRVGRTCLFSSLVFSLVTAGLITGFWLYQESRQAEKWAAYIQNDFLEEHRARLRERVDRVIQAIDWQRRLAAEQAGEALAARVNAAWHAMAGIHQRFQGVEPPALIRERMTEAVLQWPLDSEVSHWFLMDASGRCVIWDGYPEMAGRDLSAAANGAGKRAMARLLDAGDAEPILFQGSLPVPESDSESVPPSDSESVGMVMAEAIVSARRAPGEGPTGEWILCAALLISDLDTQSRHWALQYAADIRYGEQGYVFVNTLDGASLVFDGRALPTPVDNWELTDPDGNKILQLQREAALRPGGGFLRYRFPKLGGKEPAPKLSYVAALPEWNWMIGAGVYLDEIDPVIKRETAEVRRELRFQFAGVLGGVLALILMIALLARFVSRRVEESFSAFSRFLKDAEESGPETMAAVIHPEDVYFQEFTVLAERANAMVRSRNAALSALRESRERLQLTMEATRDGIWDWDLAEDNVYFSPRYYTMVGYEPDAFPASLSEWRKRVHPHDLPDADAAIQDHLEGRTPGFRIQFRFMTANGDWRWLLGRGRTVRRGPGGRPLRLLGAHTDISEQKAAEAALRERERTYRDIFENAQIGLFRSLGEEGLFVVCNDALGKMLGYESGDECAGDYRLREGYINPDERKRMLGMIRSRGQVHNFEARFRRKDGAPVWLRYSARYRPETDAIEGVVADVTDQKRAEEELRASEETARAMLNATSDTAVLLERNGAIVSCNEIFLRKSERRMEATVGRSLSEVFSRESFRRWRSELDAVFETGEPAQFEDARDGRRFTNRCYPIFGDDGRVRRVAVFSRDFTEVWEARREQAQLRDRLERSRKMEALGLLAGGVAHDLNNILSGVVGYPELLLMELPGDSPLRRPVEAMRASGLRAAAVVSDLLTVARGVASPREPVDLNGLVREYLDSPEYESLTEAHASVTLLPWLSEAPPHVSGSTVHLRKALMNLVTNAFEAVQGEGHVLVSTEIRELSAPLEGDEPLPAGRWSVLTVSDDGPGISEADREHIFEPFYTRKVMGRSGTGLGLAVVWNTVLDHDGHIRVSTGPDGTALTLFFPWISAAPEARPSESSLIDYAGSGERVLVVDDEPLQREIACSLLEKLGYRADSAESGEAALEYLRERPADLVLLDMVMEPGMNGRETFERILEIRPGQRAVIASGMAETEDFRRVKALGASSLLKKPYTLKKLGKRIREALENRPAGDETPG
ncbi:MAG: cache domain-containing protein, partial [Desulfococcaceae bacterium]